MRHSPIRSGIALLIGVGASISVDAAPLRAALDEGETRQYELDQFTNVSAMGQATEVSSRFSYRLETLSVTDDGAAVRVSIDNVRMSMAQGDISIAYDSDEDVAENAPPNPLAGALEPLVGAAMTLHIAATGEVVSVDDSVIRDSPVLSQLLEPESQRRSLSRLFRVEGAPDAIAVDDTWSVAITQDIDEFIGVRFTHTYRVESITDGVATLSLTGDARLTISDENLPPEMRPELTLHEISGRVQWNNEKSALENYSIVTDFTLAGMNPQINQRVEARLRQEQTIRRVAK